MKYFFALFRLYKSLIFRRSAIISKTTTIGALAKISNPVKKNVVIGLDSSIHCAIVVSETGNVRIGDFTTIRYKTLIESNKRVEIGSHVVISNNVIISDNTSHPVDPKARRKMTLAREGTDLWSWKYSLDSPICIKDNVWIGRNSMILRGVTIGENSIVSAGAVVTKDVPPNSLCYGNPAIIKDKKYAGN